ncbi:MAG: branched-chain amino acid ABC transporter permease [Nitrososphaerota archaeon]|nr:branched-chain amino acid ABC transporter permease [Nitrososphaerales archaeon]MDW8044977.1 branched-chain amino acid ABC transporter permease [Nitrososphaerota archaeon]
MSFKIPPVYIPMLGLYFILLILRFTLTGFEQFITLIWFYITLGQAFNIFLGMTGYVDFGYSAFLALGMYGMAISVISLSKSALAGTLILAIGVILGIVLVSLLALTIGGIALRLRGAYFAIATIGVNEGLRFLIEGAGIWGGSEGLIMAKPLRDIFGESLVTVVQIEFADYALFTISLATAFITHYIITSRMGYALKAIKEDEDAAKVLGVNTTKYKILAFLISAIIAGLIGSMLSLKIVAIFPPQAFLVTYVVEAITIVVIGGAGTLLGPIFGGLIYASLKYLLMTTFPGLQLLILAPLLLSIILFFPEGAVSWLKYKARGTRFEGYLL